jgi:hypothetical protein
MVYTVNLSLFHTIASPIDRDDLCMVQEAVEKGCCQNLILECVIMPFSLIALLVEAILEA